MTLRLGITGMDPSTESELRSAFEQAQSRLGGRWVLAAEAEADHVVVDMDSMYGPMSWIRLHAAGKRVIGLTTSARTQADHRLPRPCDTETLAVVLAAIADGSPPAAAAAPEGGTAPSIPAPEPVALRPAERPQAANEETAAASLAAASEQPADAPRERGFSDWLAPGALTGRWRLTRGGASVAFDADALTYHGPAPLKPLAALFEGPVAREELEALDSDAWAAVAGAEARPLLRLRWYGALLAGRGRLLPGNDPEGRYRLLKWPQTEREFPKHFRIATAMMKGPATIAEIAAASGVTQEETADFVNANLATGFAEPVAPEPPESAEPARAGRLFGRLRGR